MKIDHIGIVVKDISKSASLYQKTFKLKQVSKTILDPIQKVYVQFLKNGEGQKIELVQPLNKTSPSFNALLRGGGVNHICFQTKDIKKEIVNLKKQKCIVVCPPVAGAGHEGRLIAFVVHPLLGLIELVE